MDKLHFLTAGIPSNAKDYSNAFLKLEEMNIGAVLKIHLNDGEPFNNISRTFKKDGQQIISSSSLEDGSKIIYVKKLVETLSE